MKQFRTSGQGDLISGGVECHILDSCMLYRDWGQTTYLPIGHYRDSRTKIHARAGRDRVPLKVLEPVDNQRTALHGASAHKHGKERR